jgi:hypothetical protein
MERMGLVMLIENIGIWEERRRLRHAFIPIYTLYPSNALKLEFLVDQCCKPLRMTAM